MNNVCLSENGGGDKTILHIYSPIQSFSMGFTSENIVLLHQKKPQPQKLNL